LQFLIMVERSTCTANMPMIFGHIDAWNPNTTNAMVLWF